MVCIIATVGTATTVMTRKLGRSTASLTRFSILFNLGTAITVCALQFFIGKHLGNFYNERITARQSLGQKNASLAVWIADTYLLPIVSVSADIPLVCQNLFNAWQLWMTSQKKSRR